jgi:hypothetical protein
VIAENGSTANRMRRLVAVAAPVINGRHRTDKPVASSRKRFDVSRRVGRVTQRAAQPSHGGVDAVLEVDVCVGRPQSRAELVAAQYLARSLQQSLQEAEALAL